MDTEIILEGTYLLYPSGKEYHCKLLKDSFVYEAVSSSPQKCVPSVIDFGDIIGCHVMRVSEEYRATKATSSFFCIYAYPLNNKRHSLKDSQVKRERKAFVFEVCSSNNYEVNLKVSRRWQAAFLWRLRGATFETDNNGKCIIPEALPAQRHFLCLVNPKSGPGKSLEIFLNRVRPILTEADVSYLLLVTERQNHAKEFVKNLDIDYWNAIIVVSGDGLLFEVYNGLMERVDHERAVKIPVGIIPGGSGNGLARSICHQANEPYVADPILACTIGVVRGTVVPMDLVYVESLASSYYSFLTVGWGILSDIDIESERFRAIGEIRFTLYAFWRIFNLRTYSGRISYIPAAPDRSFRLTRSDQIIPSFANANAASSGGRDHIARSISVGDQMSRSGGRSQRRRRQETAPTEDLKTATARQQNGGRPSNGMPRSYSVQEHIEHDENNEGNEVGTDGLDKHTLQRVSDQNQDRVDGGSLRSTQSVESAEDVDYSARFAKFDMPPLNTEIPKDSDWVVEEGRFVIVYMSLQSHLGTNLYFAPGARLDDGVAWILIIKGDVSRRQVAQYLIRQEEGRHIDLPFLKIFPVRALRLESFQDSLITIDGEVVRTKQLQAKVLPSMARVMSPCPIAAEKS